jgi:cyclic pyranopterin phosphate synthase
MRYVDALATAQLWAELGGFREIELGALEPLLWKDGNLTLPDLVRGLTALGFRVTMTTNASILRSMAHDLKNAGLSLLRISWHTTDPERYRQISGHGDYRQFQAGIEAATQAGLNTSFNRVLFRGFTSDLPAQIDFIERHGLRLKIYDLMWTPEIADYYSVFYQDWRAPIREFVLPKTVRIERTHPLLRRKRLRFHLRNGAVVEVKVGDGIDREQPPCSNCIHKNQCLEVFGDYLRVDPEMQAYFCYLRRDIGVDIRAAMNSPQTATMKVQLQFEKALGNNYRSFIKSTPLRFIVVPYCNYNCFFPGTTISWCHKTSGDYSFPGRPRSAFFTRVGEVANARSL